MPRGRPKTKPLPIEPTKGRKSRKVDPVKALQLRNKGYTVQDIADKFNVGHSAVSGALSRVRKLILSKDEVKEYKNRENDLLTSAQARFITAACDNEAIKKASTMQLVSSYGILFDKQRILNNQATQNIALHSTIQAAEEKLRTLENLIGDTISSGQEAHNQESPGSPPETSD